MDDLIGERVAQKEAELNATYDERLRNYAERETDLQTQVTTVKAQLTDLRTTNDSAQTRLLDASQRQDTEVVAKLGELDLVVADLDRANARVATVERRNELLRAEVESVKSGSAEASRVRELEAAVVDLEGESGRLLRALEGEKEARAGEHRAAERRADELKRAVAETAREVEQLRRRTKEYHDYDEIKRELEIMKVRRRPACFLPSLDVPPADSPHVCRSSSSSLAASTSTRTRRTTTTTRPQPAPAARSRCPTPTRPRPTGGRARASRSS